MCNCNDGSSCKVHTLIVNGTSVCSGKKEILKDLAESVKASEPEWIFVIQSKCECSESEEVL